MGTYDSSNEAVLRPLVEPGQYTSLDLDFEAGNADMQLSIGSTGDAYDKTAMETF